MLYPLSSANLSVQGTVYSGEHRRDTGSDTFSRLVDHLFWVFAMIEGGLFAFLTGWLRKITRAPQRLHSVRRQSYLGREHVSGQSRFAAFVEL